MAKERLRENFYISKENAVELPFQESAKLVEDAKGNKYSHHGVYEVDISRYDHKNLNGRVYSKKLWENVVKKQKGVWEGSVGLSDHPSKEGSTKDIFCVWGDLKINESTKTVKAKMYLVGEHGERARQVLEAGGKVGLSSSGFGEMDDDGVTVNEDTYEIERPADWVLTPSQEVYANTEDYVESTNINNVKESISVMANTKISTLEEKKLKVDVKSLLEVASTISSPQAKLKEMKELFGILGDYDTNMFDEEKEALAEKIAEGEKDITELTEKGQKFDEAEEELKELKITVESLQTELKVAESKNEMADKTIESLQSSLEEAQGQLKVVEAKVNSLPEVEELEVAQKTISELEETIEAHKSEIQGLVEALTANEKELLEVRKASKVQEGKKEEADKLAEAEKAKFVESEKADFSERVNKFAESKRQELKQIEEQKAYDEKFGFRADEEVLGYFEMLKASHGEKVSALKEGILKCATVSEAKRYYFNHMDDISPIRGKNINVKEDKEDPFFKGGEFQPRSRGQFNLAAMIKKQKG
jgi:flagellar basal body rod protein FlgC